MDYPNRRAFLGLSATVTASTVAIPIPAYAFGPWRSQQNMPIDFLAEYRLFMEPQQRPHNRMKTYQRIMQRPPVTLDDLYIKAQTAIEVLLNPGVIVKSKRAHHRQGRAVAQLLARSIIALAEGRAVNEFPLQGLRMDLIKKGKV